MRSEPPIESRYITRATVAFRGRGARLASREAAFYSHSSEESTEPLYRADKGQAAGTCAPKSALSAPDGAAIVGSASRVEARPSPSAAYAGYRCFLRPMRLVASTIPPGSEHVRDLR